MRLVGHAAGDTPWTAWSLDLPVIALSLLGLALFAHGFLRLRRRRAALAPWSRAGLFASGVALSALAIVSPLDHLGEEYLQSAHMLQHVVLADIGPALMLLAVRGPLSLFFLPKLVLRPLARLRRARAALDLLLHPTVSVALWVAVLVVWHVPRLYEAALHQPAAHAAMHVGFVTVGLLLWSQIVDPGARKRLSLSQRLGVVALVFWIGQILAYVIAFTPEPLFATYVDQPIRLLGLSPLTDQKLAAVVMIVEQMASLGIAFWLLYRARARINAPVMPAAGLARR